MNTKILGNAGEEAAADYLEQKGYTVCERNYRTVTGEIDLIVRKGAATVFVEVKTRRSLACGEAALAVNYRKQQKIIRTAYCYMQQKKLDGRPCRFDVVEVYRKPAGGWTINHFEGAFEVS